MFQNEARLAFQVHKKETTAQLGDMSWEDEADEAVRREAQFYYSWGNNLTNDQLEEVY